MYTVRVLYNASLNKINRAWGDKILYLLLVIPAPISHATDIRALAS